MVLVVRHRRRAFYGQRVSFCVQFRTDHVAVCVIGRRCGQTADLRRGDIVGGVVGVGILCAARGGVARQIDAAVGRAFRTGFRLGRRNGVAVFVIAVGLRRFHPQRDVVKVGGVDVVIIRRDNGNFDDFFILVRLAEHQNSAPLLPIAGISIKGEVEYFTFFRCVSIVQTCNETEVRLGFVGHFRNTAGQRIGFAPTGKQECRTRRRIERKALTGTM